MAFIEARRQQANLKTSAHDFGSARKNHTATQTPPQP